MNPQRSTQDRDRLPPPSRLRRLSRQLAFALGYAAFLIAVLTTVIYLFFYRPRLAELRERQRPETDEVETPGALDPETARRLGTISTDKRSHFVHFPPQKPDGVRRVCAFGDSYTQGAETGPEHDFSSFLQRRLDQHAPGRFEVLNFGNAWHGFHQAYIAWEALAPRYGCDLTLLGPEGFFAMRDTRFNHTQLRSPYYLHARYVLEDGDVRLVQVLGDTHRERFDQYFRFLPRWRYLRYDRAAPFVLTSLVPKNRELQNFFYYRSDKATPEAKATYAILLARMANAGKPIILGHYEKTIVAIGREVASPHLKSFRLFHPELFPYGAPLGHNSAYGNQLVAEQFFDLIEDRRASELTLLETLPLPALPGSPSTAPPQTPISVYANVAVTLNERPVGHFYTTAPGLDRGNGGRAAFHNTETVALLALGSPGESTVNACFVPLTRPLREGMRLSLRSGGEEHLLGRVRLLGPGLNVGAVDIPGLRFVDLIHLRLRDSEALPLGVLARSEHWSVLLDGEPILRGQMAAKFLRLFPLRGRFYRLRSPPRGFFPLAELAQAGRFHLLLKGPDVERVEVPLASWRKTRQYIDWRRQLRDASAADRAQQ